MRKDATGEEMFETTNHKKRLNKIGFLAWRRTYLYSDDNYLQIFAGFSDH